MTKIIVRLEIIPTVEWWLITSVCPCWDWRTRHYLSRERTKRYCLKTHGFGTTQCLGQACWGYSTGRSLATCDGSNWWIVELQQWMFSKEPIEAITYQTSRNSSIVSCDNPQLLSWLTVWERESQSDKVSPVEVYMCLTRLAYHYPDLDHRELAILIAMSSVAPWM